MATKKTKQLWMTAADIHQNTIFMMSEPISFGFRHWPRLGLGDNISRYFTHYQGDFSRMHYLRREFDRQAVFLSEKMLKNPAWASGYIEKVERWSKLFMKNSRKMLGAPIGQLSDKNIIALYHACLKYHRLSHGVGYSISWMADADKELVTKSIWQTIDDFLHKKGECLALADVFSILTTPHQESYVAKEEKNFLQIAIAIDKKPAVKRLFRVKKLKDLPGLLKKADTELYQLILRHHRNYGWLTYQYKGPATSLEEYLSRWQALLKQKAKPGELYNKLVNKRRSILAEQQRLIQQLKFSPYVRRLITMAQHMVFIKDFRKDALYHGMYCYEPLFREIGRRLGLTLNQITAMNSWEIPEALVGYGIATCSITSLGEVDRGQSPVSRRANGAGNGQASLSESGALTRETINRSDGEDVSFMVVMPDEENATLTLCQFPERTRLYFLEFHNFLLFLRERFFYCLSCKELIN